MGIGNTNRASILWIALLTGASTVTSLVLGCATPFPSIAALAAVTMRRRDGIVTMLIAWVVSQMIGFGLLGYPHDPKTIGWGLALGTGAVASVLGGRVLMPHFAGAPAWARTIIAYLAAFVAFKAAVLVWAIGLGGAHSTIDPPTVLNQFVRNGAILIGFALLHRLLLALGIPPAPAKAATR